MDSSSRGRRHHGTRQRGSRSGQLSRWENGTIEVTTQTFASDSADKI